MCFRNGRKSVRLESRNISAYLLCLHPVSLIRRPQVLDTVAHLMPAASTDLIRGPASFTDEVRRPQHLDLLSNVKEGVRGEKMEC